MPWTIVRVITVSSHDAFDQLFEVARADTNVLGFFLGGSRGKGYEDVHSDYDVHMVVHDSVAEEYKRKYAEDPPGIDLGVASLSEFQEYAAWMGDAHWDRYDFAHVRALVDRTGDIQRLIEAKGSIPMEHRDTFIRRQLGGYVNSV